MRITTRLFFLALLAHAITVPASAQQAPAPRLSLIFPAGGKAGDSFDVTATGSDLGAVETLYFSFPGVKVEIDESGAKKLDPKKAPATKGMAAPGAQLAQKFKITLPPGAPLGVHDVRIVSKTGLSNPRAFVVGDLPEILEKEPNDDILPKAQKIDMNVTVNGVIAAGTDVDYFTFPVKKGERVIASCWTSTIDSRLPVYLELYGPKSKYLGSSKNFSGIDGLVDYTFAEDGEAYLRVASFSYTQGGPDNYYRLTVSTSPWIDGVFPASIEPGKEAKVTVYGRNLPGGKLDPTALAEGRTLEKMTLAVKAPGGPNAEQTLDFPGYLAPVSGTLDGFGLFLKNKVGSSNPFFIALAQTPVNVDAGNNNDLAKAQKIIAPCEVSGSIGQRNESDFYKFDAKKGDVWSIDLFGDRLGNPLDLRYQILNEKGDSITEQDEVNETPANYFYNRSDDPGTYKFKAPADGEFVLRISSKDSSVNFGPRCGYLLRIQKSPADFRLIAMPSNLQSTDSPSTGVDTTYAFNVLVFRTADFNRDVTITGDKLPPGVTVPPQVIPAGLKLSAIGVTVAADAPAFVGPLHLIGAATTLDGKKLVRTVRGATITFAVGIQNNAPYLTRMDRELAFAVRDKAAYTIKPDAAKITVSLGDPIKIPIKVKLAADFKQNVTVGAATLPPGYSVPTLLALAGKDAGVVTIEPKGQAGVTAQPGVYTFLLKGQTNPILKPNQKPQGPPNVIQHSTPITVTVIPKQLGKLTVGSQTGASAKIAPGKESEVALKLARMYNFDGPVQIEVTVPAAAKGVSVEKLQLKAGEEDAKLRISVAAGTPPNQHLLTVKATGSFEGTPISHEAKLTIVVTK